MNFIKKNFFIILLFLFTLHQLNFFTNFFIIARSDYNERMIIYSGFCENEGYGYAKYIKKKFDIKNNFLIRNFNNSPNIHGYFHNINLTSNDNQIILIGANSKIINQYEDIGYTIKDEFQNCFYLNK